MPVNPAITPLTAAEIAQVEPRVPGPMTLGELIAELQKLEAIHGSDIVAWNGPDEAEVYDASFASEQYSKWHSRRFPNRIVVN